MQVQRRFARVAGFLAFFVFGDEFTGLPHEAVALQNTFAPGGAASSNRSTAATKSSTAGEQQNASAKKDEDENDGKELAFDEIKVVSASRTLQNIFQAPSAISALQGQDILNYGQTNLSDLFRTMPGVDVFSVNAGNVNLNPRGYNRLFSNRTLALIDNRIVYGSFFGLVLWNTFPVGLQDIENIEVVRGPSGSLYGANAVSGVINIQTKKPCFAQGLKVRSFLGAQKKFAGE